MTSSGGTATVGVTAATGCAWSVSTSAAWLTPAIGAGGTGSGSVAYTAASNTTTTPRTGTLTVAGQAVTVTQNGANSCNITLNQTTRTINAKKASGTITVTAAGTACSWTAKSSATWLTVTFTQVSQGAVGYSATANTTGAPRTGTITVGGVLFTLTQSATTSPNPPSGLRVLSGGN
jgi:hypothetical protein